MLPNYGDYLVFVDESGDHNLVNVDNDYPVFVLVFVIINKEEYIQKIIPNFVSLKLKYFGHENVIFHERDIRLESGLFGVLRTNKQIRMDFMEELSELISDTDFCFVNTIIDKKRLKSKYANPYSPYDIALKLCLERVDDLLIAKEQQGKKIIVNLEARGKRENDELELEFRRICSNQSYWGHINNDFSKIGYDVIFADKKTNSIGLQIADLIARPIGLRYLKPQQPNRAYDIIKSKLCSHKSFP